MDREADVSGDRVRYSYIRTGVPHCIVTKKLYCMEVWERDGEGLMAFFEREKKHCLTAYNHGCISYQEAKRRGIAQEFKRGDYKRWGFKSDEDNKA